MSLITHAFDLDITPGAIPLVIHVSEYDIGRSYEVTIKNAGGDLTIPSGTTAKVEGTIDENSFSENATVSGNVVSFNLTETMTAKSGKAWCKIKLTKDDEPVQTCAFILDVDKAGVEADTVIGADGFQEQINQAVAEYIEDSGLIIDSTLSRQGAAADAKVTGDGFSDLKSALGYLFEDEQLINARYIEANNNTALVNNNDGTYTIGTNDFGNTTFGGLTTLTPGDYYLFGVPNGIAYLSTDGTSQSYANRVFENTSDVPKKIHIDTEQQLWVCFRSPSRPTSSYTISPSLYFHKPKVYDALRFMGVLESGTDLNDLLDSGIYLLSSDRSYTNAPLTSGYLFVLATGAVIQQICIQYGSSLMSVGAIYKRDGSNSGVTADWHRLGRLFNHNIAFFGDSIMWGRDGSASASTRTNWQIPVIVHEVLSVSVINYGVSGQGFLPTDPSPSTAYDNISGKNLTNFDTLVMCYGVNDGYHLLGEWDSTDETTIMGQFNKIINYIYTAYPTMRVIVFAPFNGTNVGSYPDYWYGPRNHPDGYPSRKTLSDTLKQACDYYWIPYIEQYDSPVNAKTITQFLPDGVHPSDEAYKLIGEWFAAKIGGLIS